MDLTKGWMRYLIPGFIFQSVVIGGGYGTGAEIAQFFGVSGMKGGLLGLLVTMVVWGIVCAITFEFCRVFKTFDYGSMMQKLLGPVAYLYDLTYYLMMFIVLGVVNATASAMMDKMIPGAGWAGIAILSGGSIFLVFKGTKMIENVLAFWSYVLYAVYIVFVIGVYSKFGDAIANSFATGTVGSDWLSNGFVYSFYNLVVVPLILYSVADFKTRKEAVVSGLLAGAIGVIPGILLHLAMGCDLENVVKAAVPVGVVFDKLDMRWLYVTFQVVLFGTLIETETGFVKAFTDRVENFMKQRGKEMNSTNYISMVLGVVLVGIGISAFGLLNLIAKGYGTACWLFLILYAVPMCTLGVYKVMQHKE